MLNAEDFKPSIFHDNGLGGQILLMTHKESPDLSFTVKYELPSQSHYEYIGQHLIKALGYDAIPAELMLFPDRCASAIRYIPNLQRISLNTAASLSVEQERKFIGLFVLNGLINNPDAGEIYLGSDGKIYCLDLGETLCGIRPEQVQDSFQIRLDYCLNNITQSDEFTANDIIDAAADMLIAISELDISRMQPCLDELARCSFVRLAQRFQMTLEHLKNCALIELNR